MTDPHKYDVLREAERKALADKELSAAAQAVEQPFLTAEDKIKADRAALTEKLDAKVRAGQITAHDRSQQLQRFEVHGTEPQSHRRTAIERLAQDEARRQASLGARTTQVNDLEKGGSGKGKDQGPKKGPELGGNPFER
jgi:hypothetical protein